MKAEVEILLLPYDSADGRSLLHRLIAEADGGNWTRMMAAVAFARVSGNYLELVRSLRSFAERGGDVSLTFGADSFGADTKGSDFDAVRQILDELDPLPTVRVFLYREPRRTFHPKIYLFDSLERRKALLILGSSNWSHGGLVDNVEANAIIHFDLDDPEHGKTHARLVECFEMYWSEE